MGRSIYGDLWGDRYMEICVGRSVFGDMCGRSVIMEISVRRSVYGDSCGNLYNYGNLCGEICIWRYLWESCLCRSVWGELNMEICVGRWCGEICVGRSVGRCVGEHYERYLYGENSHLMHF